MLTLVGASGFAFIVLVFVALGATAAVDGPTGRKMSVIISLVMAAFYGGCAVGIYLNWRVASLASFAGIFVQGVLAYTETFTETSGYSSIVAPGLLIAALLLFLPAIAGILGTFVTARLRGTGGIWNPIGTLRLARVLTLVGVSCFAFIALSLVALGPMAAVDLPTGQKMSVIISYLVVAAFYGGCAVGTYFNWHTASLVGFAGIFVLGVLAFTETVDRIVAPGLLVTALLLSVPAIAGILGTFLTARLRGTGEGHVRHGVASDR